MLHVFLNVQLTASGTVAASGEINFDTRLTLNQTMAAFLPPENAERWNLRDDGSRSITFKLTGSLAEPESNFREKLQMDQTPALPDQEPANSSP